MTNHYYINVYKSLAELANPEFQYKVWVNNELYPNYISWYSEFMCSLFDDFSFDMFVNSRIMEYDNIDPSFVEKIRKLRDMLNAYDEGNKTDAEIIQDPKWIEVTKLAKEVKDLWPFDREEIY